MLSELETESIKTCTAVLQPTHLKKCNFYFERKWSPFPVCIAFFTVSQPLGEYLGNVCRKVGNFHLLVPKAITVRFLNHLCNQFDLETPDNHLPTRLGVQICGCQGITDWSLGLSDWGLIT